MAGDQRSSGQEHSIGSGADLKRLGKRGSYGLGRLRLQGIVPAGPPPARMPRFGRRHRGPAALWLRLVSARLASPRPPAARDTGPDDPAVDDLPVDDPAGDAVRLLAWSGGQPGPRCPTIGT